MIGQAPSRRALPGDRPLSGAVGAKIARMAGLTLEQFLERTWTANLIDEWPGKRGKGDAFPKKDAALGALRVGVSKEFVCATVIVLLGRSVAAAFAEIYGAKSLLKADVCEPLPGGFAILPHPSGIDRWYNDAANRRRAASFLKRIYTGELYTIRERN